MYRSKAGYPFCVFVFVCFFCEFSNYLGVENYHWPGGKKSQSMYLSLYLFTPFVFQWMWVIKEPFEENKKLLQNTKEVFLRKLIGNWQQTKNTFLAEMFDEHPPVVCFNTSTSSLSSSSYSVFLMNICLSWYLLFGFHKKDKQTFPPNRYQYLF